MSDRTDRFIKRKAVKKAFKQSSHLKVYSNSDAVKSLLSGEVDARFIDNIIEKGVKPLSLEVSEQQVLESLEILDKQFSKKKYDVLFQSSKEVLIDQLLKPLKLSRSDLSEKDRDFKYRRDDYLKSPKSAGGEGQAFDTIRSQSKNEVTNPDGMVKDQYTGESHSSREMDLDHIKSIKEFHESGGYMLTDIEKRKFGSDGDNHAFTKDSINRSKRGDNLQEYSEKNEQLDKRRTNAAQVRGDKAAEKYVPSGDLEKIAFVGKRSAEDGLKVGSAQGIQQATGVLLSEFVSSIYSEVNDTLVNGWKNNNYELSWIGTLKMRLGRIKDKLLSKWKNLAIAFSEGLLSGLFSAIITAIINMFTRTAKNIVRVIREGFMSLMKALNTLFFPPEGMSLKQAAHEAMKVLATGLVITGGIIAGETLATMLGGVPFANTIAMVLAGLISGLGSLFVVFMLDKLDLFGVQAEERHLFILGELEPRIATNIEEAEAIVNRLGLDYE